MPHEPAHRPTYRRGRVRDRAVPALHLSALPDRPPREPPRHRRGSPTGGLRSLVSDVGWALLGVFLALLVGGTGLLIWAVARSHGNASRRARLLAVSGSVAL